MSTDEMIDVPRPICFVVMPFGKKTTGATEKDAPAEVDYDRLWEHAFKPLIEEDLQHEAVRADADVGASIIRDMIERLALSDLVIADISIPNANVFYEVGVRHAARRHGCVLIAASWSKPPFDVRTMRHINYTLADGAVPDAAARGIRESLKDPILALRSSPTVCYELEGFPDIEGAPAFRTYVRRINAFEAKVRAVKLVSDPERRRTAAREVVEEVLGTDSTELATPVAVELVKLVRDHIGWPETMSLIERLPEPIRALEFIQEQRCLAKSKRKAAKGAPPEAAEAIINDAIADLEALIKDYGRTPERLGILGGRWKTLSRLAPGGSPDEKRRLEQAIEAYEQGRLLDLNEYYCASNLPRLLRARGGEGDRERATQIAHGVALACERRRTLGIADEWLIPTLLTAAFDAGDVKRAAELLTEWERKSCPPEWHFETALADIGLAIELLGGPGAVPELSHLRDSIVERLTRIKAA